MSEPPQDQSWTSPGTPPSAPGWGQPGWGPPPPGWGPPPPPGWGPPPPGPGYGYSAEPKPGIIPLRPLGLGEILDGAFTCIRQYPRATLGLSALVVAITQAIELPFTYLLLKDAGSLDTTAIENGTADTSEVARYIGDAAGAALVSFVISGLGLLILTGMLTTVMGKAVLGQPAPIGAAWSTIRPQIPRLVGAALLTGLLVFLAVGVGILPGLLILILGGSEGGGIALVVIGALAGACLATYLYVALALATPALVLERQRVIAALRRSRTLVRGSWWRMFGILLLATVIAQIISGIISLPFAFAGGGTSLFTAPEDGAPSFAALLLSAIGGVVAGTIVRPFSAGVVALLYVDRRIRREALDVALVAATGAPPAPPPAAAVPPAGGQPPGW